MNVLEVIKEEHSKLEKELQELEAIVNSEPVNYAGLIHIFNELNDFWNKHEEKEEVVFDVLRGNGFKIPTKEINFEHGELSKLRGEIFEAVNSGKEDKIIGVLRTKGVKMIEKVRSHMEKEDWILLSTPWEQVEFLFPENAGFMIKFRDKTEKMIEDFEFLS